MNKGLFFKDVAIKKARQMVKENKLIENFYLEVNALNGIHKYNLALKIDKTSKHKSLSYEVKGISNGYVETCDFLTF